MRIFLTKRQSKKLEYFFEEVKRAGEEGKPNGILAQIFFNQTDAWIEPHLIPHEIGEKVQEVLGAIPGLTRGTLLV